MRTTFPCGAGWPGPAMDCFLTMIAICGGERSVSICHSIRNTHMDTDGKWTAGHTAASEESRFVVNFRRGSQSPE
jgi:hypothetical protein